MDNVGLKKGYVELMDYQEDYPIIYEKEKEELLRIYKDRIALIEHVGSTKIGRALCRERVFDILNNLLKQMSKVRYIL